MTSLKNITNGLHMCIPETIERPACSTGQSVATYEREESVVKQHN